MWHTVLESVWMETVRTFCFSDVRGDLCAPDKCTGTHFLDNAMSALKFNRHKRTSLTAFSVTDTLLLSEQHTMHCSALCVDATSWLKRVWVQSQIWPQHDVHLFLCQCVLVFLSSTSSFLPVLPSVLRTQNVPIFAHHTYISEPKCVHLSRASTVNIFHFRLTHIIILKSSSSWSFDFLHILPLKHWSRETTLL